jgi:hypothetical protein
MLKPQLELGGPRPKDARELLATVIPGPLDERVRDRIVAETRRSPLALLQLPHGLTYAELAGGSGLLDARSLASRIEDSFRRRLAPLPPDLRRHPGRCGRAGGGAVPRAPRGTAARHRPSTR